MAQLVGIITSSTGPLPALLEQLTRIVLDQPPSPGVTAREQLKTALLPSAGASTRGQLCGRVFREVRRVDRLTIARILRGAVVTTQL